MSDGIVCTCGPVEVARAGHLVDCPMVTGVPVGTFRTAISGRPVPGAGQEEGFGSVELVSPEPILARVFRSRLADQEVVMVHTDDGGKVGGTLSGLTDDGTIAVIVEGRDMYEVDVTKVVVVQTLRRNDKIRK